MSNPKTNNVLTHKLVSDSITTKNLVVTDSLIYNGTPTTSITKSNIANGFGSHFISYNDGTLFPQVENKDEAVTTFYELWKTNYLKNACGDPTQYYVQYQPNGGIQTTVSEAHGYGMLITVIMANYDPNAQTIFNGFVKYLLAHPANGSATMLLASKQVACVTGPSDQDTATDGDLDIAMALLMADKQWGSSSSIYNYKAIALAMLQQILLYDISADKKVAELGDWVSAPPYLNATRSSDFLTSHYRSFQLADSQFDWSTLLNHTLYLIGVMRTNYSAGQGLLPDFIINANDFSLAQPAAPSFLESVNDGSYYYNACRTPWRWGTDYLIYKDDRIKTQLDTLNAWIISSTGGDPTQIKAGYQLNGTPLAGSDYQTMAFIAPFGVAAMSYSNQTWVNNLWNTIVNFSVESYYEDTIKLLCLIVMSGNWWVPELISNSYSLSSSILPGTFAIQEVPVTTTTPPFYFLLQSDYTVIFTGNLNTAAAVNQIVILPDLVPNGKSYLIRHEIANAGIGVVSVTVQNVTASTIATLSLNQTVLLQYIAGTSTWKRII